MKSIRSVLLVLISSLLLSVQAMPLLAGAATAKGSGEALEIAPPLLNLNGNPGQTITAKIYIRDISKGTLVVNGQANDFVAKGDSGTPAIVIGNDPSNPYSLKSFIGYVPSLLLQPQQMKIFNIPINIPKDATPGGHYGVIRFTASPPPNSGGNHVALSASLGALILLTVSGKLVENLSLSQFSVSQGGHTSNFFESDPLTFNELLKNNGNVHVIPTGILTVTDMFNKKLFVTNINRAQGNILPASQRLYSEKLQPVNINNRIMFGRYTATMSLTYGNGNKPIVASLVFWVIPLKLIAIWIVVLIGGFFLLRYGIRRYNRYILSKAQKSRNRSK